MHALNVAPSRLHENAATPEPVPSLALKVKLALVLLVGLAGVVLIVTIGPVVSISQVYEAGVGSMLPTWSTARTWKV